MENAKRNLPVFLGLFVAIPVSMAIPYMVQPMKVEVFLVGCIAMILGVYFAIQAGSVKGFNVFWGVGLFVFYAGWTFLKMSFYNQDHKVLYARGGIIMTIIGFLLALRGQVLLERKAKGEKNE